MAGNSRGSSHSSMAMRNSKKRKRELYRREIAEMMSEIDRIFARMEARDVETARFDEERRIASAKLDVKLLELAEVVRRLQTPSRG
jgi:hypothetical protein